MSIGAGAVGVVAAVAAGAVTLTSGWVNSTAQLMRMSQAMGIAFDDLQKLQAAGEQFGVEKGATAEGLASVGSTMHQAVYGGNNEALASANYLGLRMNKTADGKADVKDFTLQLADAISKQKDPYTQAHIAQIFGASSLLPLLRQGRGAVQGAMDGAGRYAGVMGAPDGELAVREYQKGVLTKQLADRGAAFGEAGLARAGEGALDAALQRGRQLADNPGGAVRGATDAVAHAAVAGLGSASRFASGQVQHFGGVVERTIAGIDRSTLGGRLNNPGNLRPVGGSGFVHFGSDAEGLSAMGRQLLRDQVLHGARTPYELLAGRVGVDGKRHMGYAPASDHNDPRGYAVELGKALGIGPDAPMDLRDPAVLSAAMSMIAKKETRSSVAPSTMLPFAQQAERRIVLEIHGLPRGSHVKARSGGATVAVGHAMPGEGT